MLREDAIYFYCLEEAEKLIDRGYIPSEIPLDEVVARLIQKIENSPNYQEILDRDY